MTKNEKYISMEEKIFKKQKKERNEAEKVTKWAVNVLQ